MKAGPVAEHRRLTEPQIHISYRKYYTSPPIPVESQETLTARSFKLLPRLPATLLLHGLLLLLLHSLALRPLLALPDMPLASRKPLSLLLATHRAAMADPIVDIQEVAADAVDRHRPDALDAVPLGEWAWVRAIAIARARSRGGAEIRVVVNPEMGAPRRVAMR